MKIGFLFPGQGSQKIGMGEDLYKQYEEVKIVYDKVKAITGIDIAKISFEGPEEKLNTTQNTQLAVLTNSLGILNILNKNNILPSMSAGLSLGEYTALINNKVISFEDGVRLVTKRGKYMQEKVPNKQWQMAAIIGLNETSIINICRQVKSGFVVPSNFNTKDQIVISGEKEAVLEAISIAKENGAKRAMTLNTAGPFHTEKLVEAADMLKEELNKVTFNVDNLSVIKNLDGKLYTKEDNIKEVLYYHMINPVRFDKVIETMLESGIDVFIEIGPGKTLSGFVKKMSKNNDIKIMNINDVKTLNQTLELLKEVQKQ